MWVSKDMARVECSGGPCPFAVREGGGEGGGEREGGGGRGRESGGGGDISHTFGYGWVGYFTFLFLVCYICTCTMSCISMYMYMAIMYMQQRYTTIHLTHQKLTCLQVSCPGGLAGDSGRSGRLGRHTGRTCPGTGTGTHAVGSPRQRRGGESRQAVDVVLAPGKGATGSWHLVGE